MEGIQVSIDKVDLSPDTFLIKVGGYVDTTTSQELDRTLEELLKKDIIRFIIDLEDVDYISSAGWGIFISEIKTIRRKGGDIKLAKMSPDVFEVFELLEFHRILKSYDSIAEAESDFERNTDQGELPLGGAVDPGSAVTEGLTNVSVSRPAVDEKALSLEDKIRRVVRRNPEYGARDIKKQLQSDRFGNVKTGVAQVYLVLRRLDLNKMKKRVLFSRNR